MRRIAPSLIVMVSLALQIYTCGLRTDAMNLQPRAASALFEQFETVLYSKSRYVSTWDTYNPLPRDEASQLRYPFAYLWEGLDALNKNASVETLASSDATLLGAKDFRAPKELGEVRSTRCYAVVLKSGSAFDFHKYTVGANESFSNGMQIWSWSAVLGEFGEEDHRPSNRPSTLFATQVGKSYLLVSNDVAELQQLQRRLTLPITKEEHAKAINKWEGLLEHEMWGFRQYRQAGVQNRMASGMDDVPPGAESLMFYLDARNQTVIVRLNVDDSTSEFAVAKLYSSNRLPPPRTSGSGAWKVAMPLSGNQESSDRTFILMGMFGFAVYL
jgi:hypothetical protein